MFWYRQVSSALWILSFIVCSYSHVMAQCTYTLHPGPQDGKDTYLRKIACSTVPGNCDTTNNATQELLLIDAWTHSGWDKDGRALIEFDLSALPDQGCIVEQATLVLSHSGTGNDHCGSATGWNACKPNNFVVRRVLEPWMEYEVNWLNQPLVSPDTTDATNYVHVGDSSQTPFATYNVNITDMVSYWLSNPDSNFGVSMRIHDEFDHYRRLNFASSDNHDARRRPKLIIQLDCNTSMYCNNIISGNLFDDRDQNCSKNNGDVDLDDWMVKIEPGPIYATTDQYGNYSANVDSGTFTITPVLKNEHIWNSNCAPSQTIVFSSRDSSVYDIDFPLQASEYCADLRVDIGVNRLRKCHNEWFKVEYCNDGNVAQDSLYIDVTFDDFIHPQFASTPFTYNADSSLRFFIDTLQPYECGFFQISTIVDCDVDFGITQCAKAEIYPRNICEPLDSIWDKSSVAVSGSCIGDSSVCFWIANTGDAGDGDMTAPSAWKLLEDGFLIDTGSFILNGGDTLSLCFPANSHTLTLEADQRPGHPGNSFPNAVVEACGNDSTVQVVSATSFYENDSDNHTEIICEVIRASYDPNEKVEKPAGLTTDKIIKPNRQMEYTIHFQNTGNDTAWQVVLRDTLPVELDPATLISSVSSHPYSFLVKDGGIVEWRFEPIALVDSATNEDESMGYVKFTIDQQPDLPNGTIIENRAGIYFDFNPPIITNYAWNTVWDTTFSALPDGLSEPESTLDAVIYPNPAAEQIHINFREHGTYHITVYNSIGVQVMQWKTSSQYNRVDLHALQRGMYVYHIQNGKGERATGKFLKE